MSTNDINNKDTNTNIHYTDRRECHYFMVVCYEFIMQCLFALPRYRFCNWIKSVFLRLQGAKIGRRVIFYPRVWIAPANNIEIGDDVNVALDVLIIATEKVKIGSRVLIGFRTQILCGNHVIPNDARERIIDAGSLRKSITIENDAWIGGNCLILPGVTIGEGAVVAGGSVVTKSVDPFTIVAGVPAKVIRKRHVSE